jgi:phosphatidylserine/phosphatidylglycerophosphate/cardiolipin synthase-like enzyme
VCQDAVVATISHAKETILVQAYSFTSAPIAGALKPAHDRGVDVRVSLDKSQRTGKDSAARSSWFTLVLQRGIDAAHVIAYNEGNHLISPAPGMEISKIKIID